MSEVFKVSGKSTDLLPASGWEFSSRPGGWWIAEKKLPDSRVVRRRFQLIERKGRVSASLSGLLWFGEVINTRKGVSSGGGSDSDLAAQFPGKVRKVLVREGDLVEQDQPLLLMEAMKMEFAIKAPFSGKVKRLLVKEGQQVSPGDRYLDLEKTP